MQEVMWLGIENRQKQLVDWKFIAQGLKWLWLVVWTPICWLFAAMFTPPPGYEQIEAHRNKARMMGVF